MIAQVNELVDDETDLPRVDIPGSWIDYIVVADKPFFIEPLFTRDPRLINSQPSRSQSPGSASDAG